MIHISWPSIFTPTSLQKLFKKNKTSLIIFILFAMMVLPIDVADAAKPKRVVSGEDAELFDAWMKTKDGTQYGFGVTKPEDVSWLMKIIIAQVLVWMGMLGFKIYDRATGKTDQVTKDVKEVKNAVLEIQVNSRHWVTEKQVADKVREEIKYLREHGSFLETPSRRSGSRDG